MAGTYKPSIPKAAERCQESRPPIPMKPSRIDLALLPELCTIALNGRLIPAKARPPIATVEWLKKFLRS